MLQIHIPLIPDFFSLLDGAYDFASTLRTLSYSASHVFLTCDSERPDEGLLLAVLEKSPVPVWFLTNTWAVEANARLLDLGVAKVVFSVEPGADGAVESKVIPGLQMFPAGRVGVNVLCAAELDLAYLKKTVASLAPHASAFVLALASLDSSTSAAIALHIQPLVSPQRLVLAGRDVSQLDAALVGSLHRQGIDASIPVPLLRLGDRVFVPATRSPQMDIAAAFAACVTSDRPDGLLPTLVVDARGTALGLVYSSEGSIRESLLTGSGVYQSRKRGLWYKGATSGAIQTLRRIDVDCDADAVRFVVDQAGSGFCHLDTRSCFGPAAGIDALQLTLQSRFASAPPESYSARLFSDSALLHAKIAEEAHELIDAKDPAHITAEAADVIYFTLAKCVANGVSLADIDRELDRRSLKVSRRPGDAKPQFVSALASVPNTSSAKASATTPTPISASTFTPALTALETTTSSNIPIKMTVYTSLTPSLQASLLKRPIINSSEILSRVTPIVSAVRDRGDQAIKDFTRQFDLVDLPHVVLSAPFAVDLMQIDDKVKLAIDTAYKNIEKFHQAQLSSEELIVETMPGITCSRFSRPISRVGLYVPGGSAILPSTALMLGIPAKVAGCELIIIATPPRKDGSPCPEVVYVANKVGAKQILMAGGAQAVAAMAYGTETVLKCDKICGPGNQYVTAAKMIVQNDTSALVSIDMPAGPSEVLVIADRHADPAFIAADLLSQAEHGPDSQVVLLTVAMPLSLLAEIETQLDVQARALPRVDVCRQSISKSFVVNFETIEEAMEFSNAYAPEHLILNIVDPEQVLPSVQNAGSVFIGPYSPESCGDYASGTNHTLPTYGFARMYSGVNTHTFLKHITTQHLTQSGLLDIAETVMTLAEVEGLIGHKRAVQVRVERIEAVE